MSKFNRKLKSYTKIFFQVTLFVLTVVSLYFILPGEPKFKYEYQKGFPWRHENLVSPFDFAILKTANELEEEKTEQLNSIVPYFVLDTTNFDARLKLLEQDLKLSFDSLETDKLLA